MIMCQENDTNHLCVECLSVNSLTQIISWIVTDKKFRRSTDTTKCFVLCPCVIFLTELISRGTTNRGFAGKSAKQKVSSYAVMRFFQRNSLVNIKQQSKLYNPNKGLRG